MVYLAHDKTIASSELTNLCSKSCQNGFTGGSSTPDMVQACNTGCHEQERVFREHGMTEHGAKMSVMHGIGMPPVMHSAVPFHQRIFQQMRELHNRMMDAMKNAKHAIIQHIQIRIHSLPPGPDGKPRYQVEIHQRRIPVAFGRPIFGNPDKPLPPAAGPASRGPMLGGDDHDMMPHGPRGGPHRGPHHGHHGEQHEERERHHRRGALNQVRVFFTDMSEPAKTALHWSLFALLVLSAVCFVWVLVRACRRFSAARSGQGQHQRLSLTKAFIKKKPTAQSGDIFYVAVNDKKPLIEDDSLDIAVKQDSA